MQKEFVPYELALKLKELGFDQECFGWWSYINGTAASFYGYHCTNSELIELNFFNKNCTAPIWQQAFDFMAFKCSIHGNVITSGRDKIYMSSEYREGYGGTKSNDETYTDIYQCRIDLLEDMIELFKRPEDY